MEKWRCILCGYIYDSAKGDPENDVAPGTAWQDVPGTWLCPECGAPKDMFEKAD